MKPDLICHMVAGVDGRTLISRRRRETPAEENVEPLQLRRCGALLRRDKAPHAGVTGNVLQNRCTATVLRNRVGKARLGNEPDLGSKHEPAAVVV